jgi:hypothetical protein
VVDEVPPIKEQLKTKFKDPAWRSSEKVRSEQVVGDDYWRARGKWTKLKRIIDRDNDSYSKTIIDPQTGEVILSVEHPLSEHRGHGSAKRKTTRKMLPLMVDKPDGVHALYWSERVQPPSRG